MGGLLCQIVNLSFAKTEGYWSGQSNSRDGQNVEFLSGKGKASPFCPALIKPTFFTAVTSDQALGFANS